MIRLDRGFRSAKKAGPLAALCSTLPGVACHRAPAAEGSENPALQPAPHLAALGKDGPYGDGRARSWTDERAVRK